MIQKLENLLIKYPGQTFFVFIILSIPPFLINLGLLPLFADEPTRANVALEMIISKNFSVPTVGGEYYYNKPPLYNWILAGFYLLSGNYSEFTTRLPAIIPMFLYAISIYLSVNYFLKDKRIAALSGILFLVNGRMLIYDSMLGHIDIFYSWLTFSSFMLIYYFLQRKNWFLLFLISYVITAITFLSKGLPSIVFQGFTLIAVLAYTKNFKKLLSWQHSVSGLVCLLIIGSYFYNYYQFNPNLEGYFSTIWDQSSKRTATEFGLTQSLIHIIQFPFEHAGHLFPASLFLLFCFHKDFIAGIKQNSFLTFISVVILANIWVYWLSPITRPRYLMMLYPLLFILWSHAYYTYRERLPIMNKTFNKIMLILALAVTISIPAAFFFDLQSIVSYLSIKIIFLLSISISITFLIWKLPTSKLLAFITLLLVVRLAFSWFILPHRLNNMDDNYFRSAAVEMGTLTKEETFYFYQYHPAESEIPFHDKLIFYIQKTRMQQVKFIENDAKPGYYFTFDRDLKNPDAILIKSYQNLKLFHVK
jgi:4-amino-4-deoxy-L-arabinose transferase-like glycosyltransferase